MTTAASAWSSVTTPAPKLREKSVQSLVRTLSLSTIGDVYPQTNSQVVDGGAVLELIVRRDEDDGARREELRQTPSRRLASGVASLETPATSSNVL
jgi:hypothetical protein